MRYRKIPYCIIKIYLKWNSEDVPTITDLIATYDIFTIFGKRIIICEKF